MQQNVEPRSDLGTAVGPQGKVLGSQGEPQSSFLSSSLQPASFLPFLRQRRQIALGNASQGNVSERVGFVLAFHVAGRS